MFAFTGFNAFGQFGSTNGNNKATTFKFDDSLINEAKSVIVSCAWSYTAYGCGKNLVLQGLLANKPYSQIKTSASAQIQQLAACDKYCLVLLENGKIYKILPKLNAELKEITIAEAPATKKRDLFGTLKPAECIRITHIAAGNNISVAVSSKNTVYSLPSQIHQFPKHESIRQCVCGFEHALILTSNGDVYSWGNGIRGQLGVEPLEVHEAPVLLEALAGIKITSIAAGGWHSAAISSFGDVYTWGFNSNGQLGLRLFKRNSLKAPSVYTLPQLLDLPPCCVNDETLDNNQCCSPIKIVSGSRHVILQMSCGALLATGWNKHAQLTESLECLNDCCDSFKKLDLKEMILSLKSLEIVCGPWCTILMGLK